MNDDNEFVDDTANLGPGFYIIGDFKQLRPAEAAALVSAGTNVYSVSSYGGDNVVYFTGTILWQNNSVYEVSALNGARAIGSVPAGTLVVAIDED